MSGKLGFSRPDERTQIEGDWEQGTEQNICIQMAGSKYGWDEKWTRNYCWKLRREETNWKYLEQMGG
jgi:hypothetical protein